VFKNILKSPSIRKMATSIASVAGAVVATVASSGVVSAETNSTVSRPIDPDTVKAGPVSIELDPTFYMKYKVNGDMGPNGTGYEDYMRPIRVAGEVVYCVEPHVRLEGNETVTRAIPLSQGITMRKPGGTYSVSGNTLIRAAFVNWFMFNATGAQIDQVVKSANALHPGEGDQMRNIRDGIRSYYNNDSNKFVFLMQLYYWWGASDGNVTVGPAPGSSDAMVKYWNETMFNKVSINGGGRDATIAVNWMVRLSNLYGNNMAAATYNNDGYILETSGDAQRLFSGATFTPKATPVAPPAPQELPLSISMQKKSTLSADEIAKSNGEYSLKDAQYGLFAEADVSGGEVKEGALPKYTLITDDNGYAKLNYIESGTWYLKELKAPKGHQLDKTTHKLIVQKGQPEVHWSGEYRIPVAYTTDKPIEKVTLPTPEIGTTLKDDQGSKTVDAKPITLVDTVSYKNLKPGTEYTVSGRLMDKETGNELSPAVTATTKFTPTSANGTVDIKFTLDASKLGGKKVVAFEKVSEGGKLVAAHEDINDEGQTVVVKSPNPSIGTTLKDDKGAKEVEPKQVTLIDTVKYTNLIVGKEYEVSGRLMDKETGKELEPAVTATTKFTAKQSNGSIDIKFTLDASKLAGKRVVAFEKVSEGGKLVAAHEDINDEDQTVKVKSPNPSIGTTLTDDKGAKEVEPVQVTLVDKVAYTNLTVGKEYIVTGRLMDKETGKELEPAVTGSAKFTPTESNGTVDVTFTLDASKLAGKKVVAFEKVSEGEKEVAVHEDINDEGQTIVVKTPNPSIGTTLKDEQGAKEVEPKQVTLIDTVKYTNLTVGKEYEVTGRLMDKETGKELEPAVTGSTKFTPTEPSGTVDVKFTFDASKLAGKRVVAFEKVSDGEKEVAVHEDINDEDQTVTIKKLNPEIGTTLINKVTGDHKASPDKEVTLVDTVKYKNLEVGKEYEVTGRLMDKATGKEFQPAVKATAKFKPTASEGSVDVTFTFDASALAGRSVVAFEVVTLDGQVVATHEDINDAGQTVEFTTPETPKPSEPKPKETPKTKVTPKTGVKGMNYGLVALIGAVVAALGLTSFAIYRKKSDK